MPQDSIPSSSSSSSSRHGMHAKESTFGEFSAKHFVHIAEGWISIGGGLIMIAGVAIALVNTCLAVYNDLSDSRVSMLLAGGKKKHPATMARVRLQLGMITALGLEVLVVSDVLETVVKSAEEYSFETLGKIAAIACCRTFLALMLGREVKEIKEEVEEEEEEGEEKDNKINKQGEHNKKHE